MFYRELMDRVDDQARELIALRARVAEAERERDEHQSNCIRAMQANNRQTAIIQEQRARVAELEAGQDEAKGFIEGLDVQNNALRKRAGEAEGRVALLEIHLRSCALILDTVGYQDTAKALRSIAGNVPSAG